MAALQQLGHRLRGDVNKVLQVLVRWPDLGRESQALHLAPHQELQPGRMAQRSGHGRRLR
ncbi:hypothetical protein LP420_27255 [Massilia sp. B-10]|nr:hypothetical protein LP420_27255 [Massilia sp. B-10]